VEFLTVLSDLLPTRMLAINVSIPNLTVSRLEQFRSPQLRIQKERPTDVYGLTENKPSFTRKHHVVIFRQSPFAANAKLAKIGCHGNVP